MRCAMKRTRRHWAGGAFTLLALATACGEDPGASVGGKGGNTGTGSHTGAGGDGADDDASGSGSNTGSGGGHLDFDVGVPPADALITVEAGATCPAISIPADSPMAYGKNDVDKALSHAGSSKGYCIMT